MAKGYMNSVQNTRPNRVRVPAMTLSIALGLLGASCEAYPNSSRRMADGKQWTTVNLDVDTLPSYCYEDSAANCSRYGRLYSWGAAQQGCRSVGNGWRLPTDDEWRQMAKHYGGVREDSNDTGRAAYEALLTGGTSGFNALLGGNRSQDGHYERLQAHGFYWTATETDSANAVFYNLGQGSLSLNRQPEGDKSMAISVRCVRE